MPRSVVSGARIRRLARVVVLLIAAALAMNGTARAAFLDENGNGLSDIWELKFGVSGLNANDDADSDGALNYQEAVAGTNPQDANSHPPTPAVLMQNGAVTLTWKSVAGKAYRVQTSDTLANAASWSNLGSVMLSDGSDMTVAFGVGSAVKQYFRLVVTDFDSDGDGVNDWEERQLGFDPFRPDTFNTGLGDKQVIVNMLAATNTITVAATDANASKAFGDTATLRFTRAGNLNPITVPYSVSGTAVANTDYTALSGSVSFPLGGNVADVVVTIKPGATITTQKTVIATISPGAAYGVGSPASATAVLSPLPVAGQVVEEIWDVYDGYMGLDDVPFTTPAARLRMLTSLDTGTDVGEYYGGRIRGYITPPTTGNYTFWVAADDASDFSLSTNDQPANLVRRCYSYEWTNYQEWNKYPSQKSGLIALTAGQRYYFEARVREYGYGDHLAVGWLKPGQTGTQPSEVVPGSVLTAYTAPYNPPGLTTLFFAPLSVESGVTNSASGIVSLRLSWDESLAVVSVDTSGLSGAATALNLRGPANTGQTGPVLINLFASAPQSDGTYLWQIPASAVSILKSGSMYASVVTAANLSGELRGQIGRAAATGSFTPPADPPPLPTTLPTANEAARFLTQATFGPTAADIAIVQRDGYAAWIDAEFAMPVSFHSAVIDNVVSSGQPISRDTTQEAFWKTAVIAPDQLRQRVAFAFSELMVISDQDGGIATPYALSGYADTLLQNSFGNFRDLLEAVTLSPAMGVYLDMLENDKANPVTGTVPNENYGREVMQLFTIGLVKLNPDGSIVLDGSAKPIPTYGQAEVIGFSTVFTGWNFAQDGLDWDYVNENWRQPMKLVPAHHDPATKRLLDGLVLPPGQTGEQDLKDAHDALFNHQNCGPFIARSLIQRLVTSNPSPAYIYRVAKKFANNGSGVRGDMKAVIKAILLDYEARSATSLTNPNFGKQREPMVRVATVYRAFNARAYNNRFQLSSYNLSPDFGQAFLDAPSVFNFFSPFFSLSGELATAGLLSPEYQITTDTTAIASSNNIRDRISAPRTSMYPSSIGLDLTLQVALASNPTALVDSLNTLMLAGQMSTGLRTQLINAVTAQPAGSPLLRAQTAVQLLATSPEFCVQK
ncbi:MAG: DUF1800 family protein [Chthoniobacteraceae bacterium]